MLSRFKRRNTGGFTLVELMIVVAIVGILAIIATPLLMKYFNRAKSAEYPEALTKIVDGAKGYYSVERTNQDGDPEPKEFPPDANKTPALDCCGQGGKCKSVPADWQTKEWQNLNFSMAGQAFQYQYAYKKTAPGAKGSFEAHAYGNVDCNDDKSDYMRAGRYDNGEIKVDASPRNMDTGE